MTRQHHDDLAARVHRTLVAVGEATPVPPPRADDLHRLTELARLFETAGLDGIDAEPGATDGGTGHDAADPTDHADHADHPGAPGLTGVGGDGDGDPAGAAGGRRAHRRHIRRRPTSGGRHRPPRPRVAVGAAALGALAAAALLILGIVALDRPEPSVRVTDPPVSGPHAPTLEESRGLTVSPGEGLRDGDTVTLSLAPDPGGEIVATQCAAEVLRLIDGQGGEGDDGAPLPALPSSSAGLDWCGSLVPLRSPAGRPDLTMEVSRTLGTPSGAVDCASAPGRCVVVATPTQATGRGGGEHSRTTSLVRYRVAPLVFDRDLPPAPTPTLTFVGGEPGAGAEGGRRGTFEDGEVVQVAGRGFPASLHTIAVTQCIARPGAAYDGNGDPCDTARTASVPIGADGTFTAEIRVFREIARLDTATGSDRLRWTACDPCALVVGIDRLPGAAKLPVEVAATGDPVRPTLRLVPGGPHQPGQRVRVEGEGFQVGQEVGVPSCIAGSWQTCGYPVEGFPHADAEGRVAIDEYPLPDTAPCPSRPGACVLTWFPHVEGAAPGLTLPLDLSAGSQ